MAFVATLSPETNREILPDRLGSGLRVSMRKGLGWCGLGLLAVGWLGLIGWEAPGLDGAARGGLLAAIAGTIPLQIADLLLQGFGLAVAVFLSIPTFWAIDVIGGRPLTRFARRAGAWIAAGLAAAPAFSAMPVPVSWPLTQGLGGAVGDQAISLTRGVTGLFGSNYAEAICGLGFFGLVAMLFLRAVWQGADASASRPLQERPEAELGGLDDDIDLSAIAPAAREAERPAQAEQKLAIRMAAARPGQAPVFVRDSGPRREESAPMSLTMPADMPPAMDEGGVFDSDTPIHVPFEDEFEEEDELSRRMAERFAPKKAASHPVAQKESAEPEPVNKAGWRDILRRASKKPGETMADADEFDAGPDEPLGDEAPVAEAPLAGPVDPPPSGRAQAAPAPVTRPVAVAAGKTAERAPRAARTWAETGVAFRVPPISLLSHGDEDGAKDDTSNGELVAAARRLEGALDDFGVRGKIIGVLPGPNVTHYEFEPAPGVKLARIVGLAQDIARASGVSTARVAPIPGRSTIGIELPNEKNEKLSLRGLMDTRGYKHNLQALPLAIGMGVDRQPIVCDLAQMPGLLVTGKSGSGKSTALTSLILSLLLRHGPDEMRLLVLDPKGADLKGFEGVAHMLAPVLSDTRQSLNALEWCAAEMDERLKTMAKFNLRGIGVFNSAMRNAQRQGNSLKRKVQTGFDKRTGRAIYEEEKLSSSPMPYLVVVIDDVDVLLESDDDMAAALQRVAHMSRAAGIHMLAATGRMDGDRLDPVLASSFPARLSLSLASKAQSRQVLNEGGAEQLTGPGDFLFAAGGPALRGQAPAPSEKDVAAVTTAIRRQGGPVFEPAIGRAFAEPVQPPVDTETYQQAVSIAIRQGSTSVADLRTKLGLPYSTANDLMGRLAAAGLLSPADDTSGRRPVLLSRAASA